MISASSKTIGWAYAGLAAVVVVLAFALFGTHETGLDCSDRLFDGVPMTERDSIYRAMGADMRVALIGVISLGVVLLITLFATRRADARDAIFPVGAVIVGSSFAFSQTFWLYSCL